MNKKIIKILVTGLFLLPFVLFGFPSFFLVLILFFLCFFEGALLKMYLSQIRAKKIKKGNKRGLLFIALCIFFMYLTTNENYSAIGFKVTYFILFIIGLIPNYEDENKTKDTNENYIEN